MNRKFRLKNPSDFGLIRRTGKIYTHPLLVLIAKQNSLPRSRFGIAAGRKVGDAVQRNLVKRRIRACIHEKFVGIQAGWDIILFARKPISDAQFSDICAALHELLIEAGLISLTEI